MQEACAAFAAGEQERYFAVVDENIEFSILAGLLPHELVIGAGKAKFVEAAGKMGEYMDVIKYVPHSWTGHDEHVGFVVDWVFRWKATDEIVSLKCVTKKTVRDGKICEKFHMVDPHAARAIVEQGRGTERKVKALRSRASSKEEEQNEERLRRASMMWAGMVDQEGEMMKDLQQGENLLDRGDEKDHDGEEKDLLPLLPVGMRVVQEGLAGVLAGKPELYMDRVDENLEFDLLGGLLFSTVATGNTKEEFAACNEYLTEKLEIVRFVPHTFCGFGGDVTFLVDWEMRLRTGTKETFTVQAVVHKSVKNGLICKKHHTICQYQAERLRKAMCEHSPMVKMDVALREFWAERPSGSVLRESWKRDAESQSGSLKENVLRESWKRSAKSQSGSPMESSLQREMHGPDEYSICANELPVFC